MKMKEQNECGCGRSPTGKCVGWHALSEEKYRERKTAYLEKQAQKVEEKPVAEEPINQQISE